MIKLRLCPAHICIAVALGCWLVLMLLTFFFGDLKQITTDPTDPFIQKGTAKYMSETAFRTYVTVWTTLGLVGVVSFLVGLGFMIWNNMHVTKT